MHLSDTQNKEAENVYKQKKQQYEDRHIKKQYNIACFLLTFSPNHYLHSFGQTSDHGDIILSASSMAFIWSTIALILTSTQIL